MPIESVTLLFFEDGIKTDLSERLKRVEGQVRGIEKMLQDNQPCPKVLQQLSATIAALIRIPIPFCSPAGTFNRARLRCARRCDPYHIDGAC